MLSIAQAARFLGVGRSTLRRWETEGRLCPVRTHGGHRRYRQEDLVPWRDRHSLSPHPSSEGSRCAVYARVSSAKQEGTGNLQRQADRCVEFATGQGYQITLCVREVASGLNERRRKLNALLAAVARNDVDVVVVEFPDRLARFGYAYLVAFCEAFHVRVETVASPRERSAQEELVEDMLTIVTSFSARLYGKRGAELKKTLGEAVKACSIPFAAS